MMIVLLLGGVVVVVTLLLLSSISSMPLLYSSNTAVLHHHQHPSSPVVVQQQQQPYSMTTACPLHPPPGYPMEFPILDVLSHVYNNKNDNNHNHHDHPRSDHRYQSLCIFDVGTTEASKSSSFVQQQIRNYRAAEVPFVVRNDPAVQGAVGQWRTPGYLARRTLPSSNDDQKWYYQATVSNSTIFTYYNNNRDTHVIPDSFRPWTQRVALTYQEWFQYPNITSSTHSSSSSQFAYLRLDACWDRNPERCDSTYGGELPSGTTKTTTTRMIHDADFIYNDLDFFRPGQSLHYDIDATKTRGIQCRLDRTADLTAEAHFDNENNYIVMMQGRRRYLLSHPRNCPSLYLYPQRHPLERHTQVNWRRAHTNDDWKRRFPKFDQTTLTQVILEAGDVLYLPTYWFHHIISLPLVENDDDNDTTTEQLQNIQCNTRSGYSVEYDQIIYDCGFLYDFPD